MTYKNYSDEQHVELAKREYSNYNDSEPIKINNGKIVIGYVSQVNNKPSGEQSFVITDHYVSPSASLADREQVNEITILYRGSTAPSLENIINPFNSQYSDMRKDWLVNDIPSAMQVINGGGIAMPQLQTSANTLKKAMELYPKAVAYVYGHSLGSMNAQYATGVLPADYQSRLGGGYFYQGPNVYALLSQKEQKRMDILNNLGTLFNFVDKKDLIPIGYSADTKSIGQLILVDSKKVGGIDQHMWGGYVFDKGVLRKEHPSQIVFSKITTKAEIARLEALKKNMILKDGRLSTSQKVFLDAMEAKAITSGFKQIIQGEIDNLKKSFQKAIKQADKLWNDTMCEAIYHGENLTNQEQLAALASGGATESSIKIKPTLEYEKILAKLKATEEKMTKLLNEINVTIEKQVALDNQLAKFIRS